jgi:hypothetical protein
MNCGFLTVITLYALGWMGVGKPTRAESAATSVAALAALDPYQALPLVAGGRQSAKTGPATEDFAPVYLLGLDPLIYGLVGSFALGIMVSWITRPMPASHVGHYFLTKEAAGQGGDLESTS